jgi:hypothetical protein
MSRPPLYVHLSKLEQAALVTGQLELPEGGEATAARPCAGLDR